VPGLSYKKSPAWNKATAMSVLLTLPDESKPVEFGSL
jgi:hypothetical protein